MLFYISCVLVYHKNAVFYKKTVVCFLQLCNLSQTGIETQRLLGTSCSRKVLSRYHANIGKEHTTVVNDAIKNALENKHAIMMIRHDYHNIPTLRRPTEGTHTCKVGHMATIIIKIVKEALVIPFSIVNLIHKPCGVNSDLLVNDLCSNNFFGQVSSSLFASSMPELTILCLIESWVDFTWEHMIIKT